MLVLEKGTTLQNGKYTIDKVLGQGGFGITYQGETVAAVGGDLGSMNVKVKVAIKEFYMQDYCKRDESHNMQLLADSNKEKVEKYKIKFVKEAEKLANINHPNIVKAVHVFEENNTVYYVMRFIEGGSLSHVVRTSHAGHLNEDQAIKYIKQIGEALSFMHNEKQMCHLDVKPANILVNSEDNAILIDFGISKSFSEPQSEQQTSSINYSNSYSPLELYQPLTVFSPQTDIYSLGATLYYLLTGTTPPEASDINNDGLPKCPDGVSRTVWMAIDKAMQPRRRDRPQSMAQWIALLDPQAAGDDGDTIVDDEDDQPTICVDEEEDKPTVIESAGNKEAINNNQQGESKDQNKVPQTAEITKTKSKNNLIYIIILITIAASAGISTYLYMRTDSKHSVTETTNVTYTTASALEQLNRPDITCAEILQIEKNLQNDGTKEEQELVKKKILALRHIYQRVLEMPDHTVKKLNLVYNTYDDIFSQEQIHIVVWFFNQSKTVQNKWENSDKTAYSFIEFKQLVEKLK